MTENRNIDTTREDAYRLLAACYYSPTQALLDENCCSALANLLAVVAPDAAAHAAEAAAFSGDLSVEALAVEHARLFIGPFQLVAPPYGSIYLDDSKTVMGDSTAKVATFYHSCGLHMADDFLELPDHFAVELEFMSYLAFMQREASSVGNNVEKKRLIGLQKEFLDTFLLPWLQPFTAAVINDGEAPFYQALARCTAAFIKADSEALTVEADV
ncbi:MAG: molecular chaperone TorD [Geobacteraceae bacterium GWC2_48_7]|nr:MAG: molecular chaperone TorD [Geobacteraceae bacterium GWC2_48_7]